VTVQPGATRFVPVSVRIAPNTPAGVVVADVAVSGPRLYAVPYWTTAKTTVAIEYSCST
jgi:hypothetical protein